MIIFNYSFSQLLYTKLRKIIAENQSSAPPLKALLNWMNFISAVFGKAKEAEARQTRFRLWDY